MFSRVMMAVIFGSLALSTACDRSKDSSTDEADTDTDTDTDSDTDTDTDTDADTDTDTDTDTDVDACTAPTAGPWQDHPLAGATIVGTNGYSDGGIGALLAAAPSDGNTTTPNVSISGVVTNIGYGGQDDNPNIWITDAGGSIRTFGIDGFGGGAVNAGDIVTLTVTELKNYFGELEITGAADIEVTAATEEVLVLDGTGLTLDYGTHGRTTVEFWGEVTGETGEECSSSGSSNCWEIENTNGTTMTINLSNSVGPGSVIVSGDCLHVIAPIEFSWGAPRLSSNNFDWIRFY